MKPFWVYILRCADDSYYTGHTDNLDRRIAQHQAGGHEGYTDSRRPVELIWSQECVSREEALAAELQIKGWSRKKKEAMMRGDWLEVSRLARSKSDHASTGSARTDLHGCTGKPDPHPMSSVSVRPELVVRQAHHDRGSSPAVRPELVEGRSTRKKDDDENDE